VIIRWGLIVIQNSGLLDLHVNGKNGTRQHTIMTHRVGVRLRVKPRYHKCWFSLGLREAFYTQCSIYLPGLSRYFDCFDSILEWDGMSGMEVVFASLIVLAVLIV
jgi:hypothetical protein